MSQSISPLCRNDVKQSILTVLIQEAEAGMSTYELAVFYAHAP